MQYLKLKHIYPVKKFNSTIINLLLPYHFFYQICQTVI